ncbi:hypothetical protein CR513_30478, partial [Mucuna pruriens]
MGRLALNRLGVVISTYHLCMKFPVGQKVGSVWANSHIARRCYEDSLKVGSHPSKTTKPIVNVLDLDLDPKCKYEHEGAHPAEDLKEIQLGPMATHKTRISMTLSPEEEACLVSFLRRNNDVFTWTTEDMPDINPEFICHRLLVAQGAKLVARKETNKLLAASFIREVQYLTWLANVVMVKKASEKWRICTDYTDLNKAFPKDPYPLPNIDRLVDGVSGFAFLSFMDAYLGYNQIRMHPHDEEKTTFITDASAFCYKVMPFSLKNGGVTYQRLIDKIFKEVMGVDIEVYVDDMVVKSTEASEHCKALERKCLFGVHARKFLGFMLTKRGIEANLDKCQAGSPTTHGQGHGSISLHLPSRRNAMPIFGTLKREGNFVWTLECEEVFLRLKAMLATPPVLTRPDPGTPLYLYISVSNATISVVLIQEKEGEKRLVYFTSKVLQGTDDGRFYSRFKRLSNN